MAVVVVSTADFVVVVSGATVAVVNANGFAHNNDIVVIAGFLVSVATSTTAVAAADDDAGVFAADGCVAVVASVSTGVKNDDDVLFGDVN